jgi:hypothetical protein
MNTPKDDNPPDHNNGYGAGNSKPPKTYKIQIDKKQYDVDNPTPMGRDLLLLAEKNPPERFQIFQRLPGGNLEEVKPDATVDLQNPNVERFVTLPLDQTEGEMPEVPLRRDFQLSESDTETLDGLGLRWETIRDGMVAAVVIRNYPVPSGYNHAAVDIHLRIPTAYPEAQLDMVYVSPALARADGRGIGALSMTPFAGSEWQQWSRHRSPANPWRRGIDDIATHLALVNHWFVREFATAG